MRRFVSRAVLLPTELFAFVEQTCFCAIAVWRGIAYITDMLSGHCKAQTMSNTTLQGIEELINKLVEHVHEVEMKFRLCESQLQR